MFVQICFFAFESNILIVICDESLALSEFFFFAMEHICCIDEFFELISTKNKTKTVFFCKFPTQLLGLTLINLRQKRRRTHIGID